MTKRRSSKSKSGSALSRILYTILILVGSLVLLWLQSNTDLLDFDDTSDAPSDTPSEGQVPSEGSWYSLYFTQPVNSGDESAHHDSAAEQALIASIDGVQRTIDGALFELNAPDTTAALVRALQRGVQVRLVVDDEHAFEDPESTLEEVIDAGAQVRSDERSALMHNKFLILDGTEVWTGSMNLTRNDIYNNNNHFMLIRSPQMAQNYQSEFDEMFLDGFFTVRGDPRQPPEPVLNLGGGQVETYFSPEDGDTIEARLVELIDNANTSIRVMAFSFTLDAVGTALVDALERGVGVEGVFETTGSLQGQMPKLACAGANVRQDGNPDILHNKVFIIDEQIVVMGSFNFSASARDNNSENLLVINNPQIAQAFLGEWRSIFEQGRVPAAEDISC